MITLFATDLDGTFLADHLSISETNVAALAAAREAGVPFVFATGRPSPWVDVLREHAHDHQLAIVSNGAAVLDLTTFEFSHTSTIPSDVAHRLVADVRDAFPGCILAAEHGHELTLEPGYREQWTIGNVGPVDAVLDDPLLFKLVLRVNGVRTEELLQYVLPIAGDRVTATFSYVSDDGHIEISANGVSKAHALQKVCDDLGVDPADVACFGDMPNDLAMLRWCGHPNVMPNAHPILLQTGFPVLPEPSAEAVGTRVLQLLAEQA